MRNHVFVHVIVLSSILGMTIITASTASAHIHASAPILTTSTRQNRGRGMKV